MNWQEKIASWLPKHFKRQEYDPYIAVLGRLFETLNQDLSDHIDQTFVTRANPEFLAVHGKERGFSRINYGTEQNPNLESDTDFSNRIRRIKYNRTHENILDNVRSVLGIVSIRIVDDYDASFLDNTDQRATDVQIGTGIFGNQGPLDLKKRWNCFSVIIDTPDRPPLSFFDSNYYYDSNAWYDQIERQFNSLVAKIIFDLIKLKAPAGSGFRLLVKDFTGVNVGDLAAQEKSLNEKRGN